MNTIPKEHIDTYLDELAEATEAEFETFMQQFTQQQTELVLYLMMMIEDGCDEEEQVEILHTALHIWYCFWKEYGENLPIVTLDTIEESQLKNEQMMEYLEAEIEEGDLEQSFLTILESYPQKYLLAYLLQEVFSMDRDYNSDAYPSMLLLLNKIVIDCFDQ